MIFQSTSLSSYALTSKLEQDSHFFVANFLTFVVLQILLPEADVVSLFGMGGNNLLDVGVFCNELFALCEFGRNVFNFSWLPVQTGIFDIEPISLFGVEHRVDEALSISDPTPNTLSIEPLLEDTLSDIGRYPMRWSFCSSLDFFRSSYILMLELDLT